MALDYIQSLETNGTAIVDALRRVPSKAIPWSDDWTVAACAQHVGAGFHVTSQVIDGRPTADFSLFGTLDPPEADDPDLAEWVAVGAAALVDSLRSVPASEPCWTWWELDRTAGFWARRIGQEALVHRWDAELGAGQPSPIDPAFAADGVDEYLDIFLSLVRLLNQAPGDSESFHFHCTDTDGEWTVTFPGPSERSLERAHHKGDVAFRGTAESLLLFLWGRMTPSGAGIEVLGDQAVAARWREFAPAL